MLLFSLAAIVGLSTASATLAQQPPSPEAPPSVRVYAPKHAPGAQSVGKPWLGVGLETRRECRADDRTECRRYVLISSVVVGSPAEEAGIEVGDVVVSVDGAVSESREFKTRLKELESGRPVAITVARAGAQVSLEVVPRPRPPKAVHVRARPSGVWAWTMPEGELRVPIVIDAGDSTVAAWTFRSDDERQILVVPTRDGWRVQVFEEPPEGEYEEAAESFELQLRDIELRDLELHDLEVDDLEVHVEGYDAEVAREVERARAAAAQARYWGRVKAELGPEMAALRDSVLALARVKLAEVRKAQEAYREAFRTERARQRYAPPAHLAEASRRIAGAEFEPLGPELSHQGLDQGLLVLRVIPGTPAYKLGLRRGDVVVEVGGAECSDVSHLREALVAPGDEAVPVKWVRKGEVMTGALND